MEKITIKDLFNRYRNLDFSKIQDKISYIGLAILILGNLYVGCFKDKKIKELESSLMSASDMISSQEDSLYSYIESDYNMRDELFYLRSRNDIYYKASDLKLFRYSRDNEWRIVTPNDKLIISDLSKYDFLFQDTPCGKVVSGYAFEYIDPTVESASVNGCAISYNSVVYAKNGEYTGMIFLLNGEPIYREVFKNGERLLVYNYHSNYPIMLRDLSDALEIEDEYAKFNVNELEVIVDSINQANALRLEIKDIN